MVAVFFPTYLVLTRIVNRLRRQDKNEQYLHLTKWLIYLSLLVGGLTLLVDLVVVLNYFLEGDLTTRFICKALAVLMVIGAAVHYYSYDARGFWTTHEQASILYAFVAGILVTVSLVFGFTQVATPNEVREHKLDAKQITELQDMQYKIVEYYYATGSSTLPADLDEAYRGFDVPKAPEGRETYTYSITDTGFSLCATFSDDMQNDTNYGASIPDKTSLILNEFDWRYKAGKFCFARVITK
jgi:hypothetical protein